MYTPPPPPKPTASFHQPQVLHAPPGTYRHTSKTTHLSVEAAQSLLKRKHSPNAPYCSSNNNTGDKEERYKKQNKERNARNLVCTGSLSLKQTSGEKA